MGLMGLVGYGLWVMGYGLWVRGYGVNGVVNGEFWEGVRGRDE